MKGILNCGIAVREGKDIVIIDGCVDNIPKVSFASKNIPHPKTVVSSSGTQYQVRG